MKLPLNSRGLGLDISDAGTAAGAPGAGAGAGVRGPGKSRRSKTMSDVYLSTYLDFFSSISTSRCLIVYVYI